MRGCSGSSRISRSSSRARLGIAVQLDERLGVLLARGAVVGRKLEHRCQQQLRIVEDPVRDADAREQPHGLDVVAVLQQERADHGLGRLEVAVREEAGGHHHLAQAGFASVATCAAAIAAFVALALHAIQPLEHAPAAR